MIINSSAGIFVIFLKEPERIDPLYLTVAEWLQTYYRHIILLLQIAQWMHQAIRDGREKVKGTKSLADTHFKIKQNHFPNTNFSSLLT